MAGFTLIRSSGGQTARVNSEYAGNFQGFINDLEGSGYKVGALGGYNYRNIAGSNTLSNHAFGNAIDVNPFSGQSVFGGRSGEHNFPDNISEMAANNGLSWGGNWRNPDSMHFEVAKGAEPLDMPGVGSSRTNADAYSPPLDNFSQSYDPYTGQGPYGSLNGDNPSGYAAAGRNNGSFADFGASPIGQANDAPGSSSMGERDKAWATSDYGDTSGGPPLTIRKGAESAKEGYQPGKQNLKKDDVPTAIVEGAKAQASAAKSAQEQSDKAAATRALSLQQWGGNLFERIVIGATGLLFIAAGVYGLTRQVGIEHKGFEGWLKKG